MTEYTAATTNASNTLTAVPDDEDATVSVTHGETEIAEGEPGKYTLTWETGENTVTIEVVNGDESNTYTMTVTKS